MNDLAADPAAQQVQASDVAPPNVPADGELPGGRIVITETRAEAVVPPPGWAYGAGLWRLLRQVAARLPCEQIEAVWAFPGVQREGREYGVAVLVREAGQRRRIYRARHVVQVKGADRGSARLEVEETAVAPSELLPAVLEGVRRRADEAGEAEPVDLSLWRAEGGCGAR